MCPSPFAIDGAQNAGGWGVALPWFGRIARLWGHQFPVSPKPEAQADCISFCVAFNQNVELGGPESDGGEIFDAIQKMEDDEDLSPTDLFDVAD